MAGESHANLSRTCRAEVTASERTLSSSDKAMLSYGDERGKMSKTCGMRITKAYCLNV